MKPMCLDGLSGRVRNFVRDEDGSATVWNLTWLTGFAIMAGVAVDTTNARRVETMMSSTADVAALAGLMELPAPNFGIPYEHGTYGDTVEAAALDYAFRNMSPNQHGTFVENSDVFVGHWDHDSRTFTWGGEPVNAVRVFISRNEAKDNRVSTSLLRLVGFDHWEINTVATAAMPLADCYSNGIVAAGKVKINSNAQVFSGCIHGEAGVEVANNVIWWEGTGVSAGYEAEFKIGPRQYDEYGADTEVNQKHTHLMPSAMAFDVTAVGRALLDLEDRFSHLYHADYKEMRVAELQDPALPVIEMTTFTIGDTYVPETASLDGGVEVAALGGLTGLAVPSVTTGGPSGFKLGDMRSRFDQEGTGANLEEFRTYYAPCTNKLTLDGTIRNVVIVSECRIEIRNDSALENVLLVSLDGTPPFAVNAGEGVRFGAGDNCAPGGGVRIWANGDFITAAGTSWQGAQIYVDGDLTLAGQTGANYGISAHVTGDVHIAALAEIAGLDADAEFVDEDEGGAACVGSVDFDWITTDYLWVLVE